jgi:hypothetical protein
MLPSTELEKRLKNVRVDMDKIRVQLEQLWMYQPPEFLFSQEFKHGDISLREDNRRAIKTDNKWTMALVVPQLSMKSASSICFKINRKCNMLVGLCYRNVAQQKNYTWSSTQLLMQLHSEKSMVIASTALSTHILEAMTIISGRAICGSMQVM